MFRCLFPSTSSPPLLVSFVSRPVFPVEFFFPPTSPSLSLPPFQNLYPPRRKMSHSTWLRAKVNASRFPRVPFLPLLQRTPFGYSSSPRRCRSKFIFYSFPRCNTVSRWRLLRLYIYRAGRDLRGNPTRFEKDNIGFDRLLSFRLWEEIVTFLVLHIWLFGI